MPVRLRIDGGPYDGVERAEIGRSARAMMRALQLKNEELSIVITDDAQIKILNAEFRGKNKPTDVLAFAMREGEFGAVAGELLGDVVISFQTAKRQASRARRPVLDEVTMLLAHGLLHLLGWDHDTKAKDRAMRAETDRLCAAASARRPALLGRVRRSKVTEKD